MKLKRLIVLLLVLFAIISLRNCIRKPHTSPTPNVPQPSIEAEETLVEDEAEDVTTYTSSVEESLPEEEAPSEVDEIKADTEPATEPEEQAESKADDSTIRPEFKEMMDSYEEFFDEYVAFMNKFSENSSDLTLLAEYATYMSKYADMVEKMDAVDESELTNAELAYYIEVNARIEQKLLTIS